ncbi:protein kinase, partial [bacterium]|nr:protein kinase [bacterium]
MSRTTKPALLTPGQILKVTPPAGSSFDVVITRPLGQTKTVFLGKRLGDDSPLVLKVPRGRPGIEDRIEREITGQFSHPNIVRLLGTSVHGGRAILVLPKLSPNPLLLLNEPHVRSRLTRDPGTKYFPVPPNVAIELVVELLRALEHIHGAGFVHNDVKISNLLVEPAVRASGVRSLASVAGGQYRGVLIDLGAARSRAFLDDVRTGRIDTDFVPPQLTPAYAAPEVLTTQARPVFGPAADMYAAGLTAYALYSGHYPYDHLDPPPSFLDFQEVAALKSRERRGEISPCDLKSLEWAPYHDVELLSRDTTRSAIEDSLRDLIRRMTSADPTKRPTAAKARSELEWVFRIDQRRGKEFAGACSILRLRPENRFTEAKPPDSETPGLQTDRAEAGAYTSSYSRDQYDVTSNPMADDPSIERAWSRAAPATGQISNETLIRYALRAVEGLVAAQEPAAPFPPPAPPPAPSSEGSEYDAILKVIGAALGSGLPQPEPPPPPPRSTTRFDGTQMLADDPHAWHRGGPELTPSAGVLLPYGDPSQPLAQAALEAGLAPGMPLELGPREVRETQLFSMRDVWLIAALARSGLVTPELIVEALDAHVKEKRPLRKIRDMKDKIA